MDSLTPVRERRAFCNVTPLASSDCALMASLKVNLRLPAFRSTVKALNWGGVESGVRVDTCTVRLRTGFSRRDVSVTAPTLIVSKVLARSVARLVRSLMLFWSAGVSWMGTMW